MIQWITIDASTPGGARSPEVGGGRRRCGRHGRSRRVDASRDSIVLPRCSRWRGEVGGAVLGFVSFSSSRNSSTKLRPAADRGGGGRIRRPGEKMSTERCQKRRARRGEEDRVQREEGELPEWPWRAIYRRRAAAVRALDPAAWRRAC